MSAPTAVALPVYQAGEVPDGLKTATQLRALRLKLAAGQEPAARLHMNQPHRGWLYFPLYEVAAAAPMRPLSAKQRAAVEARRTCPECGEVREHVVRRRCGVCVDEERRRAQELQARTCWSCRRVSVAPHPVDRGGWCDPCWIRRAIRLQVEEEQRAVWRRTCPGPGCTVVTATDEEIAAVRAVQRCWQPRWCPPCEATHEAEVEQRRRERREAEERAVRDRAQQVADLAEWARQALADPDLVVLDTETTGLHDEARIVDLAVITGSGEVLVDTLLNPGEPIPDEATDIHGITDAQVAGAPRFGDVLARLTAALNGRRCLIYNRPYDVARLRHELTAHYRQAGHDDPAGSAAAWLGVMRFEDAMIPYSDWCGDWSDYWGNYAWQPLPGGDHRAVGDCRAVLGVLADMGRPVDSGMAVPE